MTKSTLFLFSILSSNKYVSRRQRISVITDLTIAAHGTILFLGISSRSHSGGLVGGAVSPLLTQDRPRGIFRGMCRLSLPVPR